MDNKKDNIFKWTDKVISGFLLMVFVSLAVALLIFSSLKIEHGIIVDILVHLLCSSGIALITFYLLKPLERFKQDKNTNELSQSIAHNLDNLRISKKFKGINCVHSHFDQHEFGRQMLKASEIRILNTWIPNLDILIDDYISKAIINNTNTTIKILLLNPNSEIAEIRTKALENGNDKNYKYNVKNNIEDNLQKLANLYKDLSQEKKNKMEVRLYNTLPSISFYGADEKQFIGIFFHKRLAINSPQLEISNSKSVLGEHFLMEFNTIWKNAVPFKDLGNWRNEIGMLI